MINSNIVFSCKKSTGSAKKAFPFYIFKGFKINDHKLKWENRKKNSYSRVYSQLSEEDLKDKEILIKKFPTQK